MRDLQIANEGVCYCMDHLNERTSPFDIVCPQGHVCPWRKSKPPQTIPEVWLELAAKSQLFLDKARRGAGGRYKKQTDPVFNVLSGLSDRTDRCLASDVRARAGAAWCLLRELQAVLEAEPLMHFWHVTVLDNEWVTSDEKTEIKLKPMFEKARPFLAGLTGNFVAVAELQPFTNVKHDDGGKLLSLHIHAVVWGLTPFNEDQAVTDWWPRFSGLWATVAPIVIDPIGAGGVNLARVVRYPLKGPCKCKTRYHNPKTGRGNLHESEKTDRFIRYHRLFEILSRINMRWLFDAGGHGESVIEDVGEAMRAWAAASKGSRPMSPEDVEAYWATHRASRSGNGRFLPPIIQH